MGSVSGRRLAALIEQATVDAYNESEQATGFFTMIEENLALPFVTQMLGPEGAEWIEPYRAWSSGS